MKKFYKVVLDDMQSLALRRNPVAVQVRVGIQTMEPTSFIGKSDYGGIWVANYLAAARALVKYMRDKYAIKTRIFEVEIGNVLYHTPCRTKTDAIKYLREILH